MKVDVNFRFPKCFFAVIMSNHHHDLIVCQVIERVVIITEIEYLLDLIGKKDATMETAIKSRFRSLPRAGQMQILKTASVPLPQFRSAC